MEYKISLVVVKDYNIKAKTQLEAEKIAHNMFKKYGRHIAKPMTRAIHVKGGSQ